MTEYIDSSSRTRQQLSVNPECLMLKGRRKLVDAEM